MDTNRQYRHRVVPEAPLSGTSVRPGAVGGVSSSRRRNGGPANWRHRLRRADRGGGAGGMSGEVLVTSFPGRDPGDDLEFVQAGQDVQLKQASVGDWVETAGFPHRLQHVLRRRAVCDVRGRGGLKLGAELNADRRRGHPAGRRPKRLGRRERVASVEAMTTLRRGCAWSRARTRTRRCVRGTSTSRLRRRARASPQLCY
jgi:hypothetical protein